MAEEDVKMEPVELTPVAGAEPPKMANPLGKPTITATLKPGLRLPPKPGGTVGGLKPGLKLPPKPGATVGGLRPGLNLPSKPGATVGGLKPGLKLPPKPGATLGGLKPGLKLPSKPAAPVAELKPVQPETNPSPKPAAPVAELKPVQPEANPSPKPGATLGGLKPGLKLPPKPGATLGGLKPGVKLPARPVIRKPGESVTTAALPKPVVSAVGAAATVSAAAPKPESKPVAVDAQGIGKLPTVEAQAIARGDAKVPEVAPNPNALEQLKSVTQKLKGITQEIPAQAVLHKTGIIADGAGDALKEAAKHKTARISLSDAMGVAPVKDENAPMKTIRIKRPVDITGATRPLAPVAKPVGAAPAAPDEAPVSATQAETKIADPSSSTVTQRKTLKITRPGGMVRPGGAVRPGASKFGVKRSAATTVAKKPEAAKKDGEVADIPDIPELPPAPLTPIAVKADEGAAWAWTLSAVVQLAACVVIGAVAYFLYENTQTLYF